MHTMDWRRIALCGLVAGAAWTLMSIVLVSVGGGDFFAAISERMDGAPPADSHLTLYLLSVAAGVWVMWVYASIRPQIDSNVRAAVVAGLAWWIIASLQSLKWVVLLDIPTTAWLPLIANAVSSVIATVIGGLLYAASSPRT